MLRNCRIYGAENPQAIEKRPLYLEKATVFYTLWSEGGIGTYFFENDYGDSRTVNPECYCYNITDFFLPAIEEYDLKNVWLQQNSVTCHTTRANMALLQKTICRYKLDTKIMQFDTITHLCGATRKTVFMQLLSTDKPTFAKLWLRFRPICIKKRWKIKSKFKS